MQRRRIGLGIALLAFAALVAAKPDTSAIRLTLDTPSANAPVRVEAALEVGMLAITVLVTKSRDGK